MSENFLSQAEIDALLNQGSEVTTTTISKAATAVAGKITEVLGQITNRSAKIAVLEPSEASRVQLAPALSGLVIIPVEFDPAGRCLIALDEELAAKVAAVAQGQDGSDAIAMDEMGLSVIQEAFSQVAGGVATIASKQAGAKVTVGPTNPRVFDGDNTLLDELFGSSEVPSYKTMLTIEDFEAGELWVIVNNDIEALWAAGTKEAAASSAALQAILSTSSPYAKPTQPAGLTSPRGASSSEVDVKKAFFAPLERVDTGQFQNINLLMDVPLEVTVELGRTRLQIKEILDLGKGSLIELSRLAGEPVDILVNGKLLAKGEVVVIDETFAVKIVDIVSPVERVNTLQ